MPLPENYSTVVVYNTYTALDGSPASGAVTFAPTGSLWLEDTAAAITIVGQTVSVDLDDTGAFSVALPATDDPDVQPVGFTYQVTERIDGMTARSFAIQVPQGSAPIRLGDAARVEPVAATVRLIRTVNGRSPDAAGNLALAAVDLGIVPGEGTPAYRAVRVSVAANPVEITHGLGYYPAAVSAFSDDRSVQYVGFTVEHVSTSKLLIRAGEALAGWFYLR